MKHHLLLLVALFVQGVRVHAQSDPEGIIREFFNTFADGRTEKALNDLYSHSEWLQKAEDATAEVLDKLKSLRRQVGDYHGHTLLANESVANDLVIYDYFVKFDRQPLRFRFEFYRSDKEWSVFAFSFDDHVDEELEEKVKAKYFQR